MYKFHRSLCWNFGEDNDFCFCHNFKKGRDYNPILKQLKKAVASQNIGVAERKLVFLSPGPAVRLSCRSPACGPGTLSPTENIWEEPKGAVLSDCKQITSFQQGVEQFNFTACAAHISRARSLHVPYLFSAP